MHVLVSNKIQLISIPSAGFLLTCLAKKPAYIHVTLGFFLSPCIGPQI